MIRVLFVDDDPLVLKALQHRLRASQAGVWSVLAADGGAAALELLERETVDVIVTDMRMPGMDGAELLQSVRERHPQVARIVLTGCQDHDTAVKLSPVAQRILHKPCDPNLLKLAVEQCHALHRRLHDPGVLQAIGAAVKLPALPRLYWELVREMDNPRADSSSLARIIEQDVAMTARVLQVANSALFSPGRKLSHVREAVTYLGTLPLRSMVLAEKLFEASSQVGTPGFSLARLQAHSLRTAQIASTLVKDPQEKLAAFAAGMLHDIGHLVLAVGLPERYVAVRVRAISQHLTVLDAERAVIGSTHAEIGAHLLSLWGLPGAVVEAVAFHHAPALLEPARFGAVGAVHVANALAHEQEVGGLEPLLDSGYLRAAGAADTLAAWREKLTELTAN